MILRSGARVAGELVDLGGVGFTVRVNGQERQIQPSEVAVIDFNGAPPSPEAQAKINSGAQFVMLRNGQTIDGHLFDIGGTSPLRITLDTPSGKRDLASNEVAQIYMTGSVPAAAAAAARAGGARRAWSREHDHGPRQPAVDADRDHRATGLEPLADDVWRDSVFARQQRSRRTRGQHR